MQARRTYLAVLTILACVVSCFSEQDLGDTSTTCPGKPCPETEVCYRGECRARSTQGGTCSEENMRQGIDDCPIDAMCQPTATDKGVACMLLPPCGPDDACAPGLQGSVCNVDYAPGKARVCMQGSCKTSANCPAGLKCLEMNGGLGVCSNGETGSQCMTKADCKTGRCFAAPGLFGFCF